MSKFIAVFLFAGTLLTGCQENTTPESENAGVDQTSTTSPEEMVKRGEYLVTALGCHDCHTPKKMGPQGPELDQDYFLAGHPANVPLPKFDLKTGQDWILFFPTGTAAVGPWGASFAANLTSDPTGVGNWTEENFLRAIREGKLKGLENGRPLLPLMPWQGYAKMTDEDLKAIFAFLKSTNPVQNIVPQPIPPDVLAKQ